MAGDDWGNDFGRAVALFVNGEGIRERGQYGQRHVDSSFLLFFNAHDAPIEFATPPAEYGEKWEKVIETAEPSRIRPSVVEAGSKSLGPGPLARRAGQDGLNAPDGTYRVQVRPDFR
jgi:glycogen operon protein